MSWRCARCVLCKACSLVRFAPTPELLRKKIESIIRKGQGEADVDAPDDPESVQFWVTRKAKYNQTATLNQSQQMRLNGKASTAFVDGMTKPIVPSSVGAILQPGRPRAASMPTTDEMLQTSAALRDNAAGGSAPARAKSKAKASAANRRSRTGVVPQGELTTAEKKAACRS